MAAIGSIPSLYSISRCNSSVTSNSSSSLSPPLRFLRFQRSSVENRSVYLMTKKSPEWRRIRSVAEETVIPEEEEKEDAPVDQPVSVPVSPSDVLAMLFQAEGTMAESNVPTVTKALQEIEGVGDVKVQVVEGIASVELSKQTTVQATGVASNLVEIIQGTGFKLQTLNLSFEDEEDAAN
ncbi:uncharacterized protein LOC122653471 [Telopea speciosissima]|uniref:uncharacterized protein LOC122653471 n=1 Tax=Telopea speciosissima TaxID=54955 RepID=UPI001CC3F374|nr:uncharacterized protein LOC122653471 [Telopea speciosissima]